MSHKIDWTKVYEGWRNHLLPPEELKSLIQQTSSGRLEVCGSCPHHSKYHNTLRFDDHCTICGCPLVTLTKCLSCDCSHDVPKWKAVMTVDQEDEINKQ